MDIRKNDDAARLSERVLMMADMCMCTAAKCRLRGTCARHVSRLPHTAWVADLGLASGTGRKCKFYMKRQ